MQKNFNKSFVVVTANKVRFTEFSCPGQEPDAFIHVFLSSLRQMLE
jgi:hypothetical protein